MTEQTQDAAIVKTSTRKKLTAAQLKHMRDSDRKPVKGIFRFHECPGGEISFYYRKYKEDPLERFTFTDGIIYTIPLGVAKHLKNNCRLTEYEHIIGPDGRINAKLGLGGYRIKKRIPRLDFESLDFIEDPSLADIGNELYIADVIRT
jgi:hypothetical protein